MKNKIPLRSLMRLNWLLAIVFGSFIGIFLFTYHGTNSEGIFTVIQSTVNILAIAFINLLVMVQVEKYGNHYSSNRKLLYRYAIAFALALLYSFCTGPIREVFADETWRIITFKQKIITKIVGTFGVNILIISLQNLVIAYQAKNDAEIENAQLKVANAEANNLLLKQQIHPHFLFNALNIIKTLYKKDTREGDIYIVHLANFLRAAISNTSAKVVSLDSEIQLCADYIAMQKIRFGEALRYQLDTSLKDTKEDFVPSFSLQPLLENAIKHNDATDEAPLAINVYKEDGYVVVKNNLQRKKLPVPSTGSGLANLMKRYGLISGDEVIIKEDGADFSVQLKILKG